MRIWRVVGAVALMVLSLVVAVYSLLATFFGQVIDVFRGGCNWQGEPYFCEPYDLPAILQIFGVAVLAVTAAIGLWIFALALLNSKHRPSRKLRSQPQAVRRGAVVWAAWVFVVAVIFATGQLGRWNDWNETLQELDGFPEGPQPLQQVGGALLFMVLGVVPFFVARLVVRRR